MSNPNPYAIARETLDALPSPPNYVLQHGPEVFEVVLDPVLPSKWNEVETALLRALPCPFIMVEAEPPTTRPDPTMPNVFHHVPRREIKRSTVRHPSSTRPVKE